MDVYLLLQHIPFTPVAGGVKGAFVGGQRELQKCQIKNAKLATYFQAKNVTTE